MQKSQTYHTHIGLVVALLVVAALFPFLAWRFWPAAAQVYTPRGQGEVYLALGDSLAWGFRLERPQAQSYPALLHERLNARAPLAFVNLAVPGETSGSMLQRQLPRALELIEQRRQAGQRVSPITLDIGGNDLVAAERGTPSERAAAVEATRRNIGAILDALRQASGDSDIVVMTYYNPYGGDPAVVNSEAYWVTQLNAAIKDEAGRRGVAVADVYDLFDGGRAYTYTYILLDDIHANEQGHQVMAAQFWQALGYER